MASEPRYFETPAAFRAWLRANHATAAELLVGFHKIHTHSRGRRCITWPQSVAEALCFGWIDGLRRRLDDDRYTIRFTPRRKGSVWSAVNIRMVATLEAAGRMTHAGRAAFEARPHKTGPKAQGYTHQRRNAKLPAAFLREFKKNKPAWAFFAALPPGYRGLVSWWVINAKQEATRRRRLVRLIETSASGKRVGWA